MAPEKIIITLIVVCLFHVIDRSRFVLTTLSHVVTRAAGPSYEPLADFPAYEDVPDPSARELVRRVMFLRPSARFVC